MGKFWACEKGVVGEGDEGLEVRELREGIAEDGSGATRATAIAMEIRLFDQLIEGFLYAVGYLSKLSTLNLQENLGVGDFEMGKNAGEIRW